MKTLPRSPARAITLPELLRQLRKSRRSTQEETARAADVGRVTLNRWESGAQRPRLPELEALLTALRAGASERRQAIDLLESPSAQAKAREQVRRLADRTGLGNLPTGGDLLRAMRRRRRLAVGEAAAGAGVREWTLRRWEAGDAWPDVPRLHALCWALGAYEEEVVALTVGPFAQNTALASSLPPDEPCQHLDQLLDDLRERVALGDYALIDLHCLTLKARAWTLAVQSDAGRRLLSRACQIHAMSLSFRGHILEAKQQAQQAMEVWPRDYPREQIWFYCGVLVAQGFSGGGIRPMGSRLGGRRGRQTLRPLLDEISARSGPSWGGLEVWMLSETALCLAQEGAIDEAIDVGEEACRVAEQKTTPAELARRKSSLAGLLVNSQRPAAALAQLEGVSGNTPYHATELALVRAEAYFGISSLGSGKEWLGEAYRLISQHDLGHLTDRANALAAQL